MSVGNTVGVNVLVGNAVGVRVLVGSAVGVCVLVGSAVSVGRAVAVGARVGAVAGAHASIMNIRIPTPTVTLTSTKTPTLTVSCQTNTASLVLSVSAESLKVGDTVKVTATLTNEGCAMLGLPKYGLHIQSDGPESIFSPAIPQPVVHYRSIAPGQSDTVEFDLKAVASGQATLTAGASFEVHLGYPGPAYWSSIGSREPLIITVAP